MENFSGLGLHIAFLQTQKKPHLKKCGLQILFFRKNCVLLVLFYGKAVPVPLY